jgi:hypothetical protein
MRRKKLCLIWGSNDQLIQCTANEFVYSAECSIRSRYFVQNYIFLIVTDATAEGLYLAVRREITCGEIEVEPTRLIRLPVLIKYPLLNKKLSCKSFRTK